MNLEAFIVAAPMSEGRAEAKQFGPVHRATVAIPDSENPAHLSEGLKSWAVYPTSIPRRSRDGKSLRIGAALRQNGGMDLSLKDSIAIPEDVLFRELDDEAVLLNLKTGIYFGLNPAGVRVWQLIETGASLQSVLDTMSREYAVDGAVLQRDLLALCLELCANGLGEVVPS